MVDIFSQTISSNHFRIPFRYVSILQILTKLFEPSEERDDSLIITNVTSKWITENCEMSLKSSDYRTQFFILNYILFTAIYL